MKHIITTFLCGAGLCFAAPALHAADLPVDPGDYTGFRTTNGGGLTGTGDWSGIGKTDGFMISWVIDMSGPASHPWHYVYTLTDDNGGKLRKEVSHSILQVSDGLAREDFKNLPKKTEGPKTYSPSDPGNSNPGLPGDIYGLKFDFGGEKVTIAFDSNRSPVWGDFYAKDGKDGGQDVYVFNNGFGTMPTAATIQNFIARPDSTVVPEPTTYLMLGASLGFILLGTRRGRETLAAVKKD